MNQGCLKVRGLEPVSQLSETLKFFSHSKGFWPQQLQNNTKVPSFKMSSDTGSHWPLQGRVAPLRLWQWRQLTTQPSFLRNSHHLNTRKHELLFCVSEPACCSITGQIWAPERFHPPVTNYMFTPAHAVFNFYFYSKTREWLICSRRPSESGL